MEKNASLLIDLPNYPDTHHPMNRRTDGTVFPSLFERFLAVEMARAEHNKVIAEEGIAILPKPPLLIATVSFADGDANAALLAALSTLPICRCKNCQY